MLIISGYFNFMLLLFEHLRTPMKIQTSLNINTQIITVSLIVPASSDNEPEQTISYG